MERFISLRGIAPTMMTLSIPFLVMIPIAIWIGNRDKNNRQEVHEDNTDKTETLRHILSDAFKDRDYRCILIGFATCSFNMSIIKSHLFSQYISYGTQGSIASLTLTVYGITTMLGAVLTGFLGSKFKMKNVLGTVYAIRVFISASFLFLPKSVPFAFIMTRLLGMTGDSTVPPTMGTASYCIRENKLKILNSGFEDLKTKVQEGELIYDILGVGGKVTNAEYQRIMFKWMGRFMSRHITMEIKQ